MPEREENASLMRCLKAQRRLDHLWELLPDDVRGTRDELWECGTNLQLDTGPDSPTGLRYHTVLSFKVDA